MTVSVLAGALLASPVHAGDTDASPAMPDLRPPPTDTPRQPGRPGGPPGQTPLPAPRTIEGRVAVVERDSGRLVLDTADGPVTLMAAPEELTNIKVGDVIRVSLVVDDDDDQ
jgi:hypothetical protein